MELPTAPWRYNRKHYRLETLSNHWVKLNKREDRINAKELQDYLARYVPRHAYMSVLDYLRPQYVGTRKKTINALPMGGAFVVDVDSYHRARGHDHMLDPIWGVCLAASRRVGI